jgi:MinD-like ATPase involved in chromosome partitioning or flagellar assembly
MRRTLYSWLDVDVVADQKSAAREWPNWLVDVSAYHDGLLLTVWSNTRPEDIDTLLEDWYGARYERSQGLLLEGVPGERRLFPLSIEYTDDQAPHRVLATEPTFRRMSLLPDDGVTDWPEPFPSGSALVVAFYSFKGGVGRTTSLLSFLSALSAPQTRKRALVIDADLEAPGITTLVEADRKLGADLFSFVDLITLCHSDTSPSCENALPIATHAIKRQTLQVRSGEIDSEHFFLPAYRDATQSFRLDIRPEHLISDPTSKWVLGDIVRSLASRLEVDVVLIDLRAGLSELAGPFLFDPRIRRIVVTTPSQQSLIGTEAVLHQLRKVRPPEDRPEFYDPSVLIAFVLSDLADSDEMQKVRRRLLDQYPDPVQEPASPIGRLRVKESPFSQELLYLNSFSSAMGKISNSGMPSVMSEFVEEFVPIEAESEVAVPAVEEARTTVAQFAMRLEYAESGQGEKFLAIGPLRSLAQRFEEKVPSAVVVGSKGSGKTYTWLQIVRSQAWSRFVSRTLNRDEGGAWGLLWPFLHSTNLEQSVKELVVNTRATTVSELQLDNALVSSVGIEDKVREALQQTNTDERWWRLRWFGLLAESLGIQFSTENEAASRIIAALKDRGRRLVVAIDGLEDLFPALDRSDAQQTALRALLQGVPSYLSEVPDCPLGVLIFIRADLVSSAIPQNVGQFERLYEAFALRWNEEEALRLAVWIAREGGAHIAPTSRQLELLSAEEAREVLFPIWGRKLGSKRSREARTAEWVLAALSDFKGQVQARDLVRFFRYAAEKSRGASQQDRLLTPRAIRDAILPCSEQKVREIQDEIKALHGIFSKLQESTDRKIPFGAASSGLTVEQIQFLIKSGVLIEDAGEYFMPEIFRLGLGFQLAFGARPRVLSFSKRS